MLGGDGLGVGSRRLAAGVASLVVLSLGLSSCAYMILPNRTQILGGWVNFATNAELNLADDGTCQVVRLPRGVEEGTAPPYGEPFSADCTWWMGSGDDGEQDERGTTELTISIAGHGDLTVSILRGPKLGIRQGDGRLFEFERAQL